MNKVIDTKIIQFPKSYTYRPLPIGLFINKSKIEGQGLFTSFPIEENKKLGVSHIKINNELFRLPLGGFINHSYDPNCKLLVEGKSTVGIQSFYLITIIKINSKEELTLNYDDAAKTTKILWE